LYPETSFGYPTSSTAVNFGCACAAPASASENKTAATFIRSPPAFSTNLLNRASESSCLRRRNRLALDHRVKSGTQLLLLDARRILRSSIGRDSAPRPLRRSRMSRGARRAEPVRHHVVRILVHREAEARIARVPSNFVADSLAFELTKIKFARPEYSRNSAFMRSLYAFETGHSAEMNATTVTLPFSAAKLVALPSRSRSGKSETVAPDAKILRQRRTRQSQNRRGELHYFSFSFFWSSFKLMMATLRSSNTLRRFQMVVASL
jgi:hypothetical protein